jgi:hypothetical protein
MVVEKGRYVGIDLGKRTWEMAIITRSGKFRANKQGDMEPEETTTFYKGSTAAAGRVKLYGKLGGGDKVALEAGNLSFIMAKELEKAVGCQIRVLHPHHLCDGQGRCAETGASGGGSAGQPAAIGGGTERGRDGEAETGIELPEGTTEPDGGDKPAARVVRAGGDHDGGEKGFGQFEKAEGNGEAAFRS